MRFTLEIPIDSIEAAELAAPFLGRGDRFELCHDLASEGWTPKPELVRAVRSIVPSEVGVVAMIRPLLPGARSTLDVEAFLATPAVIEASLREIEHSAEAGADSVAIGLLASNGTVDLDACGVLASRAKSLGLVVAFLRTFDLLVDRDAGMRAVHELGCRRVVTAGVLGWDANVAGVPERCGSLAKDASLAHGLASRDGGEAVEVVPGGGVRASNAAVFAAISPHLHASCRREGRISRDEVLELTSLRGA
jgi:copper homeostasis protein CutC